MKFKIMGLNRVITGNEKIEKLPIRRIAGVRADGSQFAADYDESGKMTNLYELGSTGDQVGSHMAHTEMYELDPPMIVDSIDDGNALGRALEDYQN